MYIFVFMTGEQLFFKYQDESPAEYASLLMSIFMSIGDKLFPILEKAQANNKRVDVKPYPVDDVIRDITVDDVILV